ARSRTIGVEELRGGTATLTNFGSHGGRFATPIIRPPESAIVGFGSVRDRPVVIDGEVVARPTIPVSVGVDHRLVDGDAMTAFQEELIGVLRDPVLLLLDG
ncbi:MAG: 2-oxo acid dehydrogenase subunit E2, partial [Actinomycetota bacterium]